MIKAGSVLILCLVNLLSAFGQSLDDTVKLKEVYVTSARQITERAFYIQRIDSIVLINAAHVDLSDLLQKNSSIYIKSYGPGALATASFRGTSASHTQVLWNGLNINSPLWGQTDLSLLPVFFTDEVSLFYGSSSLLKTTGGLGGCISLSNSPSWNQGTQLSFSQTLGSFGYSLSQLKVGFSKNKFVSNSRFFFEKAKNDFRYFDNASGLFEYTRQKNADYSKKGFLQEFYYKINSRQFAGIKLMNTWSDRNLPPIMSFNGAQRYENQTDQLLNLMGEWKYYGSKSNISVNSGLIRNELGYILSNTNAGGTLINFDTKSVSHILSTKVTFQYNFSERTIIKSFGDALFTEARFSDHKENSGFFVHQKDLSVQTSIHHVFQERFSGYGLIQQKILDGKIMPFIAATGVEFNVLEDRALVFRANIGKNLHIPTLNDKYFNPGGNKNLKPETGYQADAGLQWNNSLNEIYYQVDVSGFAGWIENWILWHPSEFRYWTADNVEKVFSRGIEINSNVKGSAWIFKYQVKANYGFTKTTNEEEKSPSKGMQLIYIPKHVGNVQVFLDKNRYTASCAWHYTGIRNTSTIESDAYQIDPYYLLDVGLGKSFRIKEHSLDFNFRLNNVLDKQYQIIEQRAMPGRNYNLNVILNF